MNRYTVFYRVHKGLRALLFDTSLLLQRTDFTIEEEAGKAINRLRLVIAFLEQYRYWEDKYILPAMHVCEPGIAVEFEQEHENAYQREKKLENLLKDFSATLLPLEKLQQGAAISAQFEEVMQATIRYLSREQSLIDIMLWRYYTDFELQTIAWKIVSEAEGPARTHYSKWILRGLNNNEIVRWVKEVKQTADEEDFYQLLKIAEGELHPVRWAQVQEVLSSGVLVA